MKINHLISIIIATFAWNTSMAQENSTQATESNDTLLNEVIVVGYGTQKKSDINGAITLIGEEKLRNRSFADVNQVLNGVSGVQVINTSGYPGSIGALRIRGISSNTGSAAEPLYIVDGLQVTSIDYLDANDIKSVEVLKDGASAAIYGAQAGNGVVIITTKAGRNGHTRISFDGQWGWERLGRRPKMMNAKQYIDYMTNSSNINATYLKDYYTEGTDTDWQKEIFPGGNSQKYCVSLEGGNDKSGFYISLTNYRNNGIMLTDYDTYHRLNIQLNADYTFNPWIKVSTANNFSRTKSDGVNALDGRSSDNMMLSAMTADPLTPLTYTESMLPIYMKEYIESGENLIQDENGDYISSSLFLGKSQNPLLYLYRGSNSTKRYRLNGATSLIITPPALKGLTFTSRLGYMMGIYDNQYYQKNYFYSSSHKGNETLSAELNYNINYQWENFFNYATSIQKHRLDAMIGMSYLSKDSNYSRIKGENITKGETLFTGTEDNYMYVDYISANATRQTNGSRARNASISYFARLSWNYDYRYFLQASLRADAFDSSKLPSDTRWGWFPSVSAGWNITNEKFMESVSPSALSYLKLRTSFGINGNVNALSDRSYVYQSSVAIGASGYQFDANSGTLTNGAAINRLANSDIKWETSRQFDIGLDSRFLNHRLGLEFDYYHKETRDLLVKVDAPYETGFSSVWVNGGTVVNKGFELGLNWKDTKGDFSYSVGATISRNINKVTYVTPKLTRINGLNVNSGHYATVMEEGSPLWAFRGYRFTGIDSETGDPTFADLNGDEKITVDDMEIIGSSQPDFTYGINLSAAWKGIDLSIIGYGSVGNDIWTDLLYTDHPSRNLYEEYYTKAWRNAGDNAVYPKMGVAVSDTRYARSSAMIQRGSYFRVSQIQLGYSLPQSILKHAYIQELRIFASLDDFITITNYIGGDPVTASFNTTSGMGIDGGKYPSSKKVMVGVNLAF